jgi:hypothetical protein
MESLPDSSIIDQPRKRGRPRKNKSVEKPIKHTEKRKSTRENENREIILHLPLFGGKAAANSSPDEDGNAFTMGEGSASENIKEATDEAILTISDQESPPSDNDDEMHIGELISELKKKNKIIKQLREEISTLKNIVGESAFMSCREIRTIPSNVNFIDSKNGKTVVCEKTNIACWWCTYNFDTLPCFIPERYYNSAFYVFGNFCSYDCAAAYNIDLRDYKVSDRNSLIKKLYLTIKGTSDEIPVAPKREVLEKFGGPLTIEEYRKVSRGINKEYKLLLPPMINLIACIEEKSKDKNIIKSTIPEVKRSIIDEKNIIPVKKKLLHDSGSLNIMDTIGIKEKKRGFFE